MTDYALKDNLKCHASSEVVRVRVRVYNRKVKTGNRAPPSTAQHRPAPPSTATQPLPVETSIGIYFYWNLMGNSKINIKFFFDYLHFRTCVNIPVHFFLTAPPSTAKSHNWESTCVPMTNIPFDCKWSQEFKNILVPRIHHNIIELHQKYWTHLFFFEKRDCTAQHRHEPSLFFFFFSIPEHSAALTPPFFIFFFMMTQFSNDFEKKRTWWITRDYAQNT